jgi:hypothetical protein
MHACVLIPASTIVLGPVRRKTSSNAVPKNAVALLDDDLVDWRAVDLGEQLAAWRAFNRDADATPTHLQKCIAQVHLELLPDLDHRQLEPSEAGRKVVDGGHEAGSFRGKRWLPIEEIDQHVDDDQRSARSHDRAILARVPDLTPGRVMRSGLGAAVALPLDNLAIGAQTALSSRLSR